MTQEHLDHLSANYDANQVPKFYFTHDDQAFANPAHAEAHAKRLEVTTVHVVAHGGKVEEAVLFTGEEVAVPVDIVSVTVGNAGGAADVDIKKLNREQLAELVAKTLGTPAPEKATKKEMLALLENASKAGEEHGINGEQETDKTEDPEGAQGE